MSWLDVSRRGAACGAALALALGLSGCFRPLYGPTASGAPLQDVLAAIQVEPVRAPIGQERVTHFLRSELVFDLDGSGQPRPKSYKLAVSVSESVQTPIVDTLTGRADSGTIFAAAQYTLTSMDGREITTGRATGSASYDRTPQRFATIRAARDAEMRVARLLSEQIRTRLAAILATAS